MPDDSVIQYVSPQKLAQLEAELKALTEKKIPSLAQRIDEARQLGDLAENAEYHAAREEMAWTQSRAKELESILAHAELITPTAHSHAIGIGSSIVVQAGEKKKTYTIVGAQEADPLQGKISNESPLGAAFLGKRNGEAVGVETPSGRQEYTILEIT